MGNVQVVDFDQRRLRIDGLVAITMKQVTDDRGTVRELFRRSAFDDALDGRGIELATIAQINVTESRRGAIRGMHAEQMTKLLAVAYGEVAGAWIDLRRDSATFGVVDQMFMRPGDQILVPPGVANGFQTLSETSQYAYAFDAEWVPGMPGEGLTPVDIEVGYGWPIEVDPDNTSMVSTKDRQAPTFGEWKAER